MSYVTFSLAPVPPQVVFSLYKTQIQSAYIIYIVAKSPIFPYIGHFSGYSLGWQYRPP